MPNPIILEDTFDVEVINPEKVVYLRVSRAVCINKAKDLTITTDFNHEEFRLSKGDRLSIAIATTLEKNGEPSKPNYDPSMYHRDTLLNLYEHVMYGKIFDITVDDKGDVSAFISFGGLLCKVYGKPEALRELHFNADVFLLMSKVGK